MGSVTVSEDPTTEKKLTVEEKQLLALRKKVRQCEALIQRRQEGHTLTPQEEQKLAKLDQWRQDIAQLESP